MGWSLTCSNLCKAYENTTVLEGFRYVFEAPGMYCLMAPSGAGKTTLFRILLGLEKPDRGEFFFQGNQSARPRICAVFQEDRLISHLSPIQNAALVLPKKADKSFLYQEFSKLLPADSLDKPVALLSGGMKRRCAFLRAMIAPSDFVIMDEPFTGLDQANREHVMDYLLENRGERLYLIATHNKEDAIRLGAPIVQLPLI